MIPINLYLHLLSNKYKGIKLLWINRPLAGDLLFWLTLCVGRVLFTWKKTKYQSLYLTYSDNCSCSRGKPKNHSMNYENVQFSLPRSKPGTLSYTKQPVAGVRHRTVVHKHLPTHAETQVVNKWPNMIKSVLKTKALKLVYKLQPSILW